MPGARPHLRMEPTGVRALLVHRAAPGHRIQIVAIAAGASGECEDAVFEIEMLNQPRLVQPLGNLLGRLMLRFKIVHQPQTNQVGQFHFDRHGAAIGGTVIAQAIAVLGPGCGPIDVDNGNGRPHKPCTSVGGRGPGAVDIATQHTDQLQRVDARHQVKVDSMRKGIRL